jgi:hypothetical protein
VAERGHGQRSSGRAGEEGNRGGGVGCWKEEERGSADRWGRAASEREEGARLGLRDRGKLGWRGCGAARGRGERRGGPEGERERESLGCWVGLAVI